MSDVGASPLPIPCTTGFDVPGSTVQRNVGLCFGLVVRSVGLTKGFTGGIRSLKAGEVPEYTQVVEEARRHALLRLVEHAQQLGGNGVIGVRFDSSDVGNGLAEIVAYGTAVELA
jgi:uncharacterized protein YbjQ (UPF0145 family)